MWQSDACSETCCDPATAVWRDSSCQSAPSETYIRIWRWYPGVVREVIDALAGRELLRTVDHLYKLGPEVSGQPTGGYAGHLRSLHGSSPAPGESQRLLRDARNHSMARVRHKHKHVVYMRRASPPCVRFADADSDSRRMQRSRCVRFRRRLRQIACHYHEHYRIVLTCSSLFVEHAQQRKPVECHSPRLRHTLSPPPPPPRPCRPYISQELH